jgi:hypothetical protein
MARHVFAAACFVCLAVSVGSGQVTNVTDDTSTPMETRRRTGCTIRGVSRGRRRAAWETTVLRAC